MGWKIILEFLKGKYPSYVSAKSIIIATNIPANAVYRTLAILRKTDFVEVHVSDHKWKHPGRIYRYNITLEKIKLEA